MRFTDFKLAATAATAATTAAASNGASAVTWTNHGNGWLSAQHPTTTAALSNGATFATQSNPGNVWLSAKQPRSFVPLPVGAHGGAVDAVADAKADVLIEDTSSDDVDEEKETEIVEGGRDKHVNCMIGRRRTAV